MIWLCVCGLLAVGGLHSFLGERFLLGPLFRKPAIQDLCPQRARRLIRHVWHMVTAAWLTVAGLLAMTAGTSSARVATLGVAIMVAFNAVACLTAAGPKHPGFILFLVCFVALLFRLMGIA